jgi:hypothetical protein
MSRYTDEERAELARRLKEEARAIIERTKNIVPRDPATVAILDRQWRTTEVRRMPEPEPQSERRDTMPFNWANYIHEWRKHDSAELTTSLRTLFDQVYEEVDSLRDRLDSQVKRADELQAKCFELEREAIRTKAEQFRQHAVLEEMQGRSGKIIDMPSPWRASNTKQ